MSGTEVDTALSVSHCTMWGLFLSMIYRSLFFTVRSKKSFSLFFPSIFQNNIQYPSSWNCSISGDETRNKGKKRKNVQIVFLHKKRKRLSKMEKDDIQVTVAHFTLFFYFISKNGSRSWKIFGLQVRRSTGCCYSVWTETSCWNDPTLRPHGTLRLVFFILTPQKSSLELFEKPKRIKQKL